VLSQAAPGDSPAQVDEADMAGQFEAVVRWWRSWIARSRYRGRWREMVHRSALRAVTIAGRNTHDQVGTPAVRRPGALLSAMR
jgi:GH15 family glucan-1,4-alpha-glucosidase